MIHSELLTAASLFACPSVPEISIATDIICGFPTERDEVVLLSTTSSLLETYLLSVDVGF